MRKTISPVLAGVLQTVGLVAYVAFTMIVMMQIGSRTSNDTLGGILFLSMFAFSALFCGTLVLAYPVWLFSQKNVRAAFTVLFSTLGSMAFFLFLLMMYALTLPAGNMGY
jgi:hypothetical protein